MVMITIAAHCRPPGTRHAAWLGLTATNTCCVTPTPTTLCASHQHRVFDTDTFSDKAEGGADRTFVGHRGLIYEVPARPPPPLPD